MKLTRFLQTTVVTVLTLLSQNISASDLENQINYAIDDKVSVINSFYNDENNGLFADLPIEITEKILAEADNTKSLHLVSKGFNALFMSGILPIQFNYDIDSKASVRSLFYKDKNNRPFADFPIEITEKILAKAGNTKSLHLVSKGFNALFMSGVLPIQFTIIGSGYGKNTTDFTQEDLLRFRNVQSLELYDIRNISDVSVLRNLQNLTLDSLPIEDVSALAHIPILNLRCLRNVQDYSALGKNGQVFLLGGEIV